MRQASINNLRDLLAELMSTALHYFTAGLQDSTDEEQASREWAERRIVHLVRSDRAATLCDGLRVNVFGRRKRHKRSFHGLYKLDVVEAHS